MHVGPKIQGYRQCLHILHTAGVMSGERGHEAIGGGVFVGG